MSGPLQGRVALITGASRGIGRAIAERYAREGARVAIDDVDDQAGEAAAAALAADGGQAIYVHADVGRQDDVDRMIRTVEQSFGPVEILVNNAAPANRHISENNWDPIMDVLLRGPWLCMNAVLPGMIARQGGSIINISSVNALAGFGVDHVYSSAKAGLLGMSRSMATAYGRHGIRINVICPGTVVTEQWAPVIEREPGVLARLSELYPIGRVGQPEDIAGLAVYLAGPDSAFMTGSVLVLDGGITAGYTAFTR